MPKRIALVTGGMGDLGQTISTKMHDAGNTVVVTHSPGNRNAVAWFAEMKDAGYSFLAYEADVSNFDSCAATAKTIQTEVGSIDILVNNAGITRDVTFKKMTKQDWDTVIRTNLGVQHDQAGM